MLISRKSMQQESNLLNTTHQMERLHGLYIEIFYASHALLLIHVTVSFLKYGKQIFT